MRRLGWRVISRIGALALLGLFLVLISLPNLIDLENYRPQLVAYIQSRISGEVALGKLKLTFQHGPGVRVDGIKIVDKSRSQQISIASAIVNFDLRHLFRRHIRLSRVTLVQPRVLLQVDRGISPLSGFLRPVVISVSKPRVESADPPLGKVVSSGGGKVSPRDSVSFFRYWYFDSNISQALVEIIDGTLLFTDRCFGVSPVVTHLQDLNLLLEGQESDNPTKFTLAARALDEQGDGSLKIEGTLSSLQWPLQPDKMFLDCQVDAENLHAATYFPYYQQYVPMRFIGARVDIDSSYRGNLMGLFRSQGRIVLHQAELDYQQVFSQKLIFKRFAVDYDFRLADRYNTIETLKCTIDADGLKIKGHCLLHEARRGIDGTIEAGLEIPEFDPVKISHLLPWEILPEKIRNYYQRLQPGSRCVVDNAYLKGDYHQIVRLAEENPPLGVVGGQLKTNNLVFNIADDWPFLAVGAGRAAFDGDSLEISNLDFDWDGLSGEALNLSLQKLFHDPQIECAGHLAFDIRRLQPYLENFLEGEPKNKWSQILSKISYSGFLQGDLALKGALANLAEITWGGILHGQDLTFEFTGEPLTISRGEASFILANNRIIVENASFNLACLPLTLQGSLPGPSLWFGESRGRDLAFELSFQAQEFAPEDLNFLLGDKYLVSGKRLGPSPLELQLSGDLKKLSALQLQGRLSLDWGEVETTFMAKSFDHLSCLATFNRERVDFNHFLIEQGDSDLSFKGALVRDGDDSGYRLSGDIVAERLLVADFIPLLKKSADKNIASKVEPEESLARPVLTAKKPIKNYVVEKKSADESQARKFTAVKVDLDGVFKTLVLPVGSGPEKSPDSSSPWRYLNDFTFSFSSASDAAVTIDECRWGWGEQRSQVMVSGQLQYHEKGFDGDLEVVVQELDLDALLKQYVPDQVEKGEVGVDSPIDHNVRLALLDDLSASVNSDAVESLLSWKDVLVHNNLHIQARARHLRWQEMTLEEIEGDCNLDGSGIKIKKIEGRSFGGGLYAQAQWLYSDDSFTVKTEFNDIDFETFSDYLKSPDRGLPMQGGHGSLNLDLVWQGRSLQGWKESLGGQLDFVFHEGRLKKFTLLANVCSLLNLSQFAALRLPEISVDQGVPYQTLSGQGIIADGVLEVDDFAMQGTSFNLLCDGVISLVDEQVDLNIGVQPLQTVDKLLATIPVVGYIITGDQKTFVVIPMSASGPFDDIKIKTHTVAGLGKKAGNMIRRFFKTPVRLLQMPGKLLNQTGSEGSPEQLPK